MGQPDTDFGETVATVGVLPPAPGCDCRPAGSIPTLLAGRAQDVESTHRMDAACGVVPHQAGRRSERCAAGSGQAEAGEAVGAVSAVEAAERPPLRPARLVTESKAAAGQVGLHRPDRLPRMVENVRRRRSGGEWCHRGLEGPHSLPARAE